MLTCLMEWKLALQSGRSVGSHADFQVAPDSCTSSKEGIDPSNRAKAENDGKGFGEMRSR